MPPGNRTVRSLAFAGALCLLAGFLACGRPTGVPAPSPTEEQRLPFDREPRSGGLSPTQSSIPAAAHLPEGTSLAVRLHKPLSSASAQSGDSFDGALNDPIVADGKPLIPRGAAVVGRVLEAKASSAPGFPGHLRITLISIAIDGKMVPVDTSSIFLKAGSRDDRNPPTMARQSDLVISPERRLTFRLAQPVDLK